MVNSHLKWASEQFGAADLGDPRRTARLVKLASALANEPGKPLVNVTQSPAEMEGAYRFIRNEHIDANAIADAGFQATVEQAKSHNLLLALEDTTSLVYRHRSIRDDLGHVNQGNRHRGLFAHSVLLFAPDEKQIVGLIEQSRWTRDIATRGKRRLHAQTPYQDKEGYKWESASRAMATRLQEQMAKVVSVCDREADIYEYLSYKLAQRQRFVVRSMQSRHIEEGADKLYAFASELQSAGVKQVHIAQKGGRKARTATLDISFAPVTLKTPSNKQGQSLPVYYVGCSERNNPQSGLSWHLLTNEPVSTPEQALTIIRYYEYRWLVEEYHKVWKSDGTDIESLRLQCQNNMERLVTINGFIATRLLQLKFAKEHHPDTTVGQILSTTAWKLLWAKRMKTKLPDEVPSVLWAYEQLARLGGWKDTKRTGRASVKVLWQGW
ncbi:IS4 family transposase, partial [Neiella marina]|uniref:IS4 family transposase n=1 Tax=Neiella marina TaxID=508461 RepID=UPI0016660A93